jgi:hypothetical protein
LVGAVEVFGVNDCAASGAANIQIAVATSTAVVA